MSKIVIGWDISTSAIGVCVMRQGFDPAFHVLFPKGGDHGAKHASGAQQVTDLMWKISKGVGGSWQDEDVVHVIEERLGGFTGGFTSSQTLMALAAMNAVISFVLREWGRSLRMLPITTKRIMGLKELSLPGEDKKQTVVRLARSSCPNFPYAETKAGNWKKGVDDMADAWLLAEAGLRVLRGEASIGRSEKTGSRKGKARRAKKGRQEEG